MRTRLKPGVNEKFSTKHSDVYDASRCTGVAGKFLLDVTILQ
jgi:hypothetical protein